MYVKENDKEKRGMRIDLKKIIDKMDIRIERRRKK